MDKSITAPMTSWATPKSTVCIQSMHTVAVVTPGQEKSDTGSTPPSRAQAKKDREGKATAAKSSSPDMAWKDLLVAVHSQHMRLEALVGRSRLHANANTASTPNTPAEHNPTMRDTQRGVHTDTEVDAQEGRPK